MFGGFWSQQMSNKNITWILLHSPTLGDTEHLQTNNRYLSKTHPALQPTASNIENSVTFAADTLCTFGGTSCPMTWVSQIWLKPFIIGLPTWLLKGRRLKAEAGNITPTLSNKTILLIDSCYLFNLIIYMVYWVLDPHRHFQHEENLSC